MVSNKFKTREVGRPRLFEDIEIFEATTRVMRRLGTTKLTLNAVAKELGYSAPALHRRFGSKPDLIRSYLEWRLQAATERFNETRCSEESPLEALRVRYRVPLEARPDETQNPTDPAGRSNAFAFWFEMLHHAEFGGIVATRSQIYEAEITYLLNAAVAQGELDPACDVPIVARILFSSLLGITMRWYEGSGETLVEARSKIIEGVIAPYLLTRTAALPAETPAPETN
jgi:AcrR family transcriptional regulator